MREGKGTSQGQQDRRLILLGDLCGLSERERYAFLDERAREQIVARKKSSRLFAGNAYRGLDAC
jgi:hypothetical protein